MNVTTRFRNMPRHYRRQQQQQQQQQPQHYRSSLLSSSSWSMLLMMRLIFISITIGLLYFFVIPTIQKQTERLLFLGDGNINFLLSSSKQSTVIGKDSLLLGGIVNTESEQEQQQQQQQLAYVHIPTFGACQWNGEKVSCVKTLLFDNGDDTIPLINISEPMQRTSICDQLDAGHTPFVTIPVCVQNSYGVGVLVYNPQSLALNVTVVEDIHDDDVQDFIAGLPPRTARLIDLKRIDFPDYYKRIDDTTNVMWERFRDDNYGNMVWRYASSTMINPVTVQVDRSDRYSDLQLQDGPIDVLVIATANTLHITSKPVLKGFIEKITERVIARDVPTIVTGLGIQMEFQDKYVKFDDEAIHRSLTTTKRRLPFKFQVNFLKEVSKRQDIPSIGVRGDMTRTVCENSGISNCVSVGCPSLSISREINLGKKLETNWANVMQRLKQRDRTLKIAVTSPASIGPIVDLCRRALTHIFDELRDQVTLIEQAPLDWPKLKNFTEQNWTSIRPTSTLTSDIIQHMEFVNVESWVAGAKNYDLCISFRIHGSMMFLAAEVPTLLIPTDFRIMELIAAMKVPHLAPADVQDAIEENFNNGDDETSTTSNDAGFDFLLSLMEMAKNIDFTIFEQNRRAMLSGWKTILHKVGLEMDPALLKIIESPLEM